jgi:hypothetical protein
LPALACWNDVVNYLLFSRCGEGIKRSTHDYKVSYNISSGPSMILLC